ncbi:hypothetical protein [uncultured Salinisphaera sp.]|uniref:hypothetical protein n=1 Tax=uncultured Salinisphaera sp. TaxID=359372 RepID=UPI0032B2EE24|tara:strand:+ start:2275 stop:2586 length:312 start_codon:yes stop_codon:yes gene_type:complete
MNKQLIVSSLLAGFVGVSLAGSAGAAVQPGNYQTHVLPSTTRIDNEPAKTDSAPAEGLENVAAQRAQPAIYQDGVQPSTTRRDISAAPKTHRNEVAVNHTQRR